MWRRFLSSLSALTVVIAAFSLITVKAADQAKTAAAKSAKTTAAPKPPKTTTATKPANTTGTAAAKPWTPPRTPWGDPDLQGIYNNATGTPLQRFSQFDKPVLSDEEAQTLQEQLRKTINTDNPPRDGVGNYNELWMDQKRKELTGDKRTSLIVDPPDGRIPPRVPKEPEQQKERDAVVAANQRFYAGIPNSWLDLEPAIRCIIRTDRPPYLGIIYNNTQQIFQSPGYVAIASEMIHSWRLIPVDSRPHIGKDLQQWLGDPRGHWEGNTLVVETSNFRQEGTFGYAQGGAFGDEGGQSGNL